MGLENVGAVILLFLRGRFPWESAHSQEASLVPRHLSPWLQRSRPQNPELKPQGCALNSGWFRERRTQGAQQSGVAVTESEYGQAAGKTKQAQFHWQQEITPHNCWEVKVRPPTSGWFHWLVNHPCARAARQTLSTDLSTWEENRAAAISHHPFKKYSWSYSSVLQLKQIIWFFLKWEFLTFRLS